MIRYPVKKNDIAEVISGKWKGEQGKIIAVIRKNERVVLEMIGLSGKAAGDRAQDCQEDARQSEGRAY